MEKWPLWKLGIVAFSIMWEYIWKMMPNSEIHDYLGIYSSIGDWYHVIKWQGAPFLTNQFLKGMTESFDLRV